MNNCRHRRHAVDEKEVYSTHAIIYYIYTYVESFLAVLKIPLGKKNNNKK